MLRIECIYLRKQHNFKFDRRSKLKICLVQHTQSGDYAIIAVNDDGNIVAELIDIRQADVPDLIAAIEGGDDCHMGDPDRALDEPRLVDWSDWRILA